MVLVGDPEQLQAIEAGAAFRSVAERHGGVEITEIRRKQEDWQRDATRHLATERTAEALRAYHEHHRIHAAERLLQAADPARWQDVMTGNRIMHDNREKIEECRKAKAIAGDTARCLIRVNPEGAGR